MSLQIDATATDTIPLNVSVNGVGGPQSGLTPVVSVRDALTANSYLDFNDMTFKVVGWVAKSANLVEAAPGNYVLDGGLDLSAITLPSTDLVAEYTVNGVCAGTDHDIITIQSGSDSDIFDKVCELLMCTKNRLEVDFTAQELVLYEDDGTTVAQRWPLSTEQGELVSTQFGVQTKRGAPLL